MFAQLPERVRGVVNRELEKFIQGLFPFVSVELDGGIDMLTGDGGWVERVGVDAVENEEEVEGNVGGGDGGQTGS